MSSYIDHFLKTSRDLPNIITDSLQGIGTLDHAVAGLSQRLDHELDELIEKHLQSASSEEKKISKQENRGRKRKISSPSACSSDESLRHMKFLIEDYTDRKSQLAINAYDIIDQHIRVVDEEIKLLETAIRLNGSDVPPPPTESEMNLFSSKKKKKKNEINENEPVYCLCQKANYGDMIRCDSDDCAIEWFHYPCVGLTRTPPNKWFCPTCIKINKKGSL